LAVMVNTDTANRARVPARVDRAIDDPVMQAIARGRATVPVKAARETDSAQAKARLAIGRAKAELAIGNGQVADRRNDQLADRPRNQLVDRPRDQLADRPNDRAADRGRKRQATRATQTALATGTFRNPPAAGARALLAAAAKVEAPPKPVIAAAHAAWAADIKVADVKAADVGDNY
jgi:hypothetical protein